MKLAPGGLPSRKSAFCLAIGVVIRAIRGYSPRISRLLECVDGQHYAKAPEIAFDRFFTGLEFVSSLTFRGRMTDDVPHELRKKDR